MKQYVEAVKLNDLFTSRNDSDDKRIGDIIIPLTDFHEELSGAIVLVGVPQDEGVRRNGGRTGASKAPDAIRKAFYKLTPFYNTTNQRLSIENLRIFDTGNIRTDGVELEEIHKRQREVVRKLLQLGALPIVIGGGHDIAYPDGAALGDGGQSLGILNFDAHTDVRPLIDGKYAHSGSGFRQLLEDDTLTIGRFCEFGIQSFAVSAKHIEYITNLGKSIIFYDEIRETGNFEHSFLSSLNYCSNSGSNAVYVSFDIDAVASAFAPGVSAPAGIGFTADELCKAAELAGKDSSVKIIDIAEVNPMFDIDGRTAKLAALAIAYFISGVAQR